MTRGSNRDRDTWTKQGDWATGPNSEEKRRTALLNLFQRNRAGTLCQYSRCVNLATIAVTYPPGSLPVLLCDDCYDQFRAAVKERGLDPDDIETRQAERL